MSTIAIFALSLLNIPIALFCLRNAIKTQSPTSLFFGLGWTLHYVVGNILTLATKDLTYVFQPFDQYEYAYAISLLVGQYFMLVFLILMPRLMPPHHPAANQYRYNDFHLLLVFLFAGILFAIALSVRVGLDAYFSTDLAGYRARLGDYAGEGIGYYYYFGMLLIPATLAYCAYTIEYPSRQNTAIATVAVLSALIILAPLGGRGRVLNIGFILMIYYLLRSGALWKPGIIFTPKSLSIILVVFGGAIYWGAIRDTPNDAFSWEDFSTVKSLAIDTTRLNAQAFIIENYPATGIYFGYAYVEAVLGPLVKFLPIEPAGLIQEVSARWFLETIDGSNVKSAISPSFIGEAYLNFGVAGLLMGPVLYCFLMAFLYRLYWSSGYLSIATVLFFYQFNFFHGGLYALFDTLALTLPLLEFNRRVRAAQIQRAA